MNLANKKTDIKNNFIKISFHNFIGLFSFFMLGLVDSFFLGQKSQEDFSVAIFSSPLIFIIVSLFVGISNAKTIYFAKKSSEKIDSLILKSNYLDDIFLKSLLLCLFVLFFSIDSIINIFDVPKIIMDKSSIYIKIHYIGVYFCISNILKSAFLRSYGNSRIPARIMLLTALFNILLDPLFIFYFNMGAEGAAIATVLSWFISFLYFEYYYKKILKHSNKKKKTSISKFFKLCPSFVLSQMLNPLTFIFITFTIKDFGIDIISGVGFGTRLDKLIIIVGFAAGSALSVFIGQNRANRLKQKEYYFFAIKINIFISIILSVSLYLSIDLISFIFNVSEKSSIILESFIKINILISILNNIYITNCAYLNASDSHNKVLFSNTIKTFLILPMTLTISLKVFGLNGLFYGLFLTSFFSNIILLIISKREFFNLMKKDN